MRDPVVYDTSSGHLFRQTRTVMCRNERVSDSIMTGGASPPPLGDGGAEIILSETSPERCVYLRKSAFPTGLNALGRRGLTHDTTLRVDKCHKPDPSHVGRGARGLSRQTAWAPRDERCPQLY